MRAAETVLNLLYEGHSICLMKLRTTGSCFFTIITVFVNLSKLVHIKLFKIIGITY